MKLLSAIVVSVAVGVTATSALAVDVCSFVATKASGVLCPVRPGSTLCVPVSAKIGPCNSTLQCFGGSSRFFCIFTLIPKSGPQAQCPASSQRLPAGTNCFPPVAVVVNSPTPAPTGTDTPEPTATATPEPPSCEAEKSGPIAVTRNGSKVVSVNTDTDTVSFFDVGGGGLLTKAREVEVGDEPRSVALPLNTSRAYVANALSGDVTVISLDDYSIEKSIEVGTEPWAVVASPNGTFVYVANANDNSVSVIDTSSDSVVATIPVGRSPRALAVTNDGDTDDLDEHVYAPNFFGRPRTGFTPPSSANLGGTDGAGAAFPTGSNGQTVVGEGIFDDAREGVVDVISLRLNVNVQSLLSVFDTYTNQEIADQTFNMNRGINFDLPAGLLDAQVRDNTERMFPSVPVDIDCSDATGACWVVSQGSDFIVRMDFDAQNKPTINAPTMPGPFAVSPVTRIFTIDPQDPTHSGRNPRGIALNTGGTIGYVACPTTRDVIVADLIGNFVLQRVRSADLPAPGSDDESTLRGKIDFFTSRPPWSDRGWGGCGSCHPDGRTDNVTWSFEAGPRQTVSLDGSFSNVDPADQRALNWSPVRDENEDFELNTRGIFGGRGFITTATDINLDGITPDSDPNVRNFGPASGDRSTQQTDLERWIALKVRSAVAPPAGGGNTARGRDIFGSAAPAGANCVACHSGAKWSTSRITYDPIEVNPVPGTDTGIVNTPDAGSVFLNGFNSAAGAGRVCEVPPPPGASQRLRITRQVGTFTAANPIELRSNGISPVNTVAPALTVLAAFGGDGFNTPTLLGIFDSAPYFRAGQVQTLEEAFGIGTDPNFLPAVQAHWRAGTGAAANVLDSDASAVTDLIAFLRTIDDHTPPFPAADPAPNDATFADAAAVCDCAKTPPLGTPALDCTP